MADDGYRTQARDTARWAEELQVEHWRSLTGEERLRLMSEQCRALHRLSVLGLAGRFPQASPEELELRAATLRVGRETFERLTGIVLEW